MIKTDDLNELSILQNHKNKWDEMIPTYFSNNGIKYEICNVSNHEWLCIMNYAREYPYYFSGILFEDEKYRITIEEFIEWLRKSIPDEIFDVSDMISSFEEIFIRSNNIAIVLTKEKNNGMYVIRTFIKDIFSVWERLWMFLQKYVNPINVDKDYADISYFFYEKNNISAKNIRKSMKDFQYISEVIYPWIDIKKLTEEFLCSKENILILTWEAWVGKTTLVKYIIHGMVSSQDSITNIAYCKDENMVRDDNFWIQLSAEYDGYNMLILDDFDHGLSPRDDKKEDNSFVSKLLSFSDGIFDNNVKIIITTNREISSIDKALVRPWRCFDILKLRPLKNQEALSIWKSMWLDEWVFQGKFWNAEIVRQALLMSEISATKTDSNRDYLLEDWISVRRNFEEWYVKRVGFRVD